jgi:ribosomal protein S20
MSTAKDEVKTLLDKLPDDCSLEDVQYHLYVVEKINRGIDRAEKEGTLSQDEVERKFSKWTAK